MAEWLLIDKADDFHYFKDRFEIAKYLNISIPEVNAIVNHSRKRINKYSPSKKVYIQRLYRDFNKRPLNNTDWNTDLKNRIEIDWIKKICGWSIDGKNNI